MTPRLRSAAYLWIMLCTMPAPGSAQFSSLETEHLRLLSYSQGHEYVVPHLARCFENALRFHRRIFDYTPSERITVLLMDFGDYASGGANSVPFNLTGIGIAPFNYTYETMPPLERMNLMMNHELVHVATMDKAGPSDRFYRSLFFGKVAPTNEAPLSMLYAYLTSPRWNAPRWYIEAIAVFLETWMGGGLGRALGAYDEMVFRTMARDGSHFYDIVGLESEGTKTDFQVGAISYLYGTRFVSYLALQYGPEKLLAWYNRTDDSKAHYAAQFRNVYGVPLEDEWSRWIAFEKEWQKGNLDSLRRFPITPHRAISATALGSISRAFFDPTTRTLYAGLNYPGQTAHLAAINIDNGSIRKLRDIRGASLFYVASTAFDPASGTLFYTTDNDQWRDIYALDVRTRQSRMLLKDIRTGDLTFNRADGSLWGVRHFNGISTIVRIPHPYNDWKSVYAWDYGKDFFDLDISPDGSTLVGALADVSGNQLLVSMKTDALLSGDASFDVLFDFENSTPSNFVFTDDGRYLYGTSYYTGVSNVVRYDFQERTMEWFSNTESGYFRPVLYTADSLITFHYTGRGFVPVMIGLMPVTEVNAIRYLGNEVVNRHPVLRTWNLPPPSPATINLDSLIVARDRYSPYTSIRLASAYPVVEGYKEFASFGMRLNFSDPILLHTLNATVGVSPNGLLPAGERFHGAFNYKLWQWTLGGTYNGADFYDLFGPTKTSRKGYSLTLQHRDFLIFDEPETMDYRVTVGGYWGLERLPDYQNVSTSFDKFGLFNARIDYQHLGRSLGSVEAEKGVRWNASAHSYYVNSRLYPRLSTGLSYGILLPINHFSVWLRGWGGFSPGDREDPFANFFFGGFGNNWVDHRTIRRYRDDEAFPGVDLNQIAGTTYMKLMVEWALPPVRFRRFGIPALYCTWARLSLFTSGITTNMGNRDARQVYGNSGGQIDFRLVLFSSLESTLSLGYALAAEEGHRPNREFMISLKIL